MQFDTRLIKSSDGSGDARIHQVRREARDRAQLEKICAAQGETLLSAVPVTATPAASMAWPLSDWQFIGSKRDQPVSRRRASTPNVALPSLDMSLEFARDLSALLRAGLSVPEALKVLSAELTATATRTRRYAGALAAIEMAVRGGQTLAQALLAVGGFSEVLIAALEASAATGTLNEAMARYARYAEQLQTVRRRVQSALIYPAVISAVGVSVFLFILLFLVPRLSVVYADAQREIPVFSRWLFGFGRWLHEWPLIGYGVLSIVLTAAAWVASDARLRQRVWRRIVVTRWVAERWRVIELARLYRTLGMLTQSGLPVRQALIATAPAAGALLRDHVLGASQHIAEGAPIRQAFERHRLTTAAAASLLGVGERSGDMSRTFSEIGAFYEEEAQQRIDWFLRLFEPVVMLALSVGVGVLLLLMYMPIFELSGGLF